MNHETYDLAELAQELSLAFPEVAELYLFGSRRYRTRSQRSDVDVLVTTTGHVRPNDLRAFSQMHCPALDLFLVDGGKAVSCANESYVQAETFDEMVARLDAVKFWTKHGGRLTVDIDWQFTIPIGIEFVPTAMLTREPIPSPWAASVKSYFRYIEQEGLSTLPYVGGSYEEVTDFLIRTIRTLPSIATDLNSRGTGWEVALLTEYDFQNLFFLCVKPWLPGLGREEITITYDGQEKRADFNLFANGIVLEMKYIKDANTKAQVVKTLEGLARFYVAHPNIRALIFAVLVDLSVTLDDIRWETDFSYLNHQPQVQTVIVRNILEQEA